MRKPIRNESLLGYSHPGGDTQALVADCDCSGPQEYSFALRFEAQMDSGFCLLRPAVVQAAVFWDSGLGDLWHH